MGKELAARLLHKLSDRRDGPIIAVNSVSIPESMFGGELFGHRRYAFSGASKDHAGLIENVMAEHFF